MSLLLLTKLKKSKSSEREGERGRERSGERKIKMSGDDDHRENSSSTLPHFVFVSFPGQGHLTPLLRLARRVASNGTLVTFCSTSGIGHMISSSNSSKNLDVDYESTVPVGSGFFRFEFFSDGLSPDVDMNRIPITTLMHHLNTFGSSSFSDLVLRQPKEGRPPVSFIVCNPFVPWALDVAEELRIRSAVLWVQSCSVFSIYYHYYHSLVDFPSPEFPNLVVKLPGVPPLTADELPTFLLPETPFESLKLSILELFKNISKASWVFANSFEDLERDAAAAMNELLPVTLVGPLIDEEEDDGGSNRSIQGSLYRASEECLEWLDKQEPLSVVYVSVGSIVKLGEEEVREIAFGLRDSGKPFLWVVRNDMKHLLPSGFTVNAASAAAVDDEEEEEEKKKKLKGIVVSWSPQQMVLRHVALSCFLTHCGWNSTLESLESGVPVIAFPQFGDQITDAKFLVEVYKVGVKLSSPVRREKVVKCVAEMTDGPAAAAMKKTALEWKTAASAAVAQGGSSDRNIKAFVDEVRNKLGKKSN